MELPGANRTQVGPMWTTWTLLSGVASLALGQLGQSYDFHSATEATLNEMYKCLTRVQENWWYHDDLIKWKHFRRYWPFVRGIHRSSVNSPHKGQWRGALMISSICAWINGWVNNREAGDFRCHHAHYDATVMRPQHNKGMCIYLGYTLYGHVLPVYTTKKGYSQNKTMCIYI